MVCDQCVLHGRITFFLSSKQSHFEIAISCFDKLCVGNSTLTLTAALCGLALCDTQSSVHYVYCNTTSYDMWMYRLSHNTTSKRKVFLGNLQLEHILFYFHNLFQLLFELEKKSSLVTHGLSTKSCMSDTDRPFLTQLTPHARDGLSVSLVQDLVERARVTKLDSYNLVLVSWPIIGWFIMCQDCVTWENFTW